MILFVEVGDYITMTVDGTKFSGKVMEILEKHTAYPYSTFEKYLTAENLDYWQRRNHYILMMSQMEPKSFDRVVLKTENQGILIVPYKSGTTIELEVAYGKRQVYTCNQGRVTVMVR